MSTETAHDLLQNLRVFAWNAASLEPAALTAIERRAADAAGRAAVVATCQRLEVYTLEPLDLDAPRCHCGREALLHIAAVAAGLDSLVLGETEVLGQVRSALAAGPARLRSLCRAAVAAARELRREYAFTHNTGHVLDHALGLAGTLPGGRLLILGTGRAGRRVAERGCELGFEVVIAGRREPALPDGVRFVPLGKVRSLEDVDVAAACLGGSAARLEAGDLPPVSRLIVDLGTPRNFLGPAPARLVDIAEILAHQSTQPALHEQREALRARLAELLDRHLASAGEHEGSPVVLLRNELERIRKRELRRTLRLHPDLEHRTLEAVTRSLVNQLFHTPTRRLRQHRDAEFAASVARLFAEEEGS